MSLFQYHNNQTIESVLVFRNTSFGEISFLDKAILFSFFSPVTLHNQHGKLINMV